MTSEELDVSIVIPVYNEEAILHAAIVDLRERLQDVSWSYEIVLAENGSRDDTLKIAKSLAQKYGQVRFISVPEPNYGRALREGIEAAKGRYVLCDEIDLWTWHSKTRRCNCLIPRQRVCHRFQTHRGRK